MLNTLITSKTRLKLITKFFLNPQIKTYLRGLEEAFGESSNGIRIELNRFEQAGLLVSTIEGNRKLYTANTTHVHYPSVHNILLQHLGINTIIEKLTHNTNAIDQIWLIGEYAKGNDNPTIDLLLIGMNIDKESIQEINFNDISLTGKKVLLSIFEPTTFANMKTTIHPDDICLLWESTN